METQNRNTIPREITLESLYADWSGQAVPTGQTKWFVMLKWLATNTVMGTGHYTIYLPNKMNIVSDNLNNVNGKLPEFTAARSLTFVPNDKDSYSGANIKILTHNESTGAAYPAYQNCTENIDQGYCMVFNTSVTFQGVNIATNMKQKAGCNLIKVKSGTHVFRSLGMEYFRKCNAITCSGGNLTVQDVNFKNASGGTNVRFYNTNSSIRPSLVVNGANLFHTGDSSTCVKIGVPDRTGDRAVGNLGNINIDGNVADIGGSLLFCKPGAISLGEVNVVNNSISGDIAFQKNDYGNYSACVYIGGETSTRYEKLKIIGNSFFLDGTKKKRKVVAIFVEDRPRLMEKKSKIKISGIFYINNADKKDFPIIIPKDVANEANDKDSKMFIGGIIMSMLSKNKDNKFSGVQGIGLLTSDGKVERLEPDDKIKRTKLYINAV